MKRRRPIEVWPAFADLMTILSVPGLFFAMSVLGSVGQDFRSVEELARQNRELRQQLDEAMKLIREQLPEAPEDPEELRQEIRARARNRAMFLAIQKVQKVIDGIAGQGDLQFSADQTLQFGDDLVSFDLNSTSVSWKAGGKKRLHGFCESLREQLLSGQTGAAELRLFQIEVEGHTDSTLCAGDPNCNWVLSSGRAVAFMSLIRDESLCPGGSVLNLKPVGYADTKPEALPGSDLRQATRRIALRIVPNYQAITSTAGDSGESLEHQAITSTASDTGKP
jgi:outer membrane protein OmpA-like peptidoglycan-associated protein